MKDINILRTSTVTSRVSGGSTRFVSLRTTGFLVVAIAVALQITFRNPVLLRLFDRFLDSLQDKRYLANYRYLKGNFAPVEEEHVRVPLEVVEGALPKDLDGLFLRNGPNPFPTQKITKRYHWFDGNGMLHNVRFQPHSQQPSATYTNQYIPTPRFQIEKKLGKEVFSRLNEFTGVTGLIKVLFVNSAMAKAHGLTTMTMGQANQDVYMYRNKFWCIHDANLPFEVQLDNDGKIVKTVGFDDFDGALNYPMASHPKVDPVTGNLLFHGYGADPALRDGPIKVGEYNSNRQEFLTYSGIRYKDNHDFSISHEMLFTKNWMIEYDNPIRLDPSKILVPNASIFVLQSTATLRYGFIPRHHNNNVTSSSRTSSSAAAAGVTKDALWIDTGAPHGVVHPLTAWEEEDDTVVVWSTIADDFDGNMESGRNVFHMAEFRMNPNTGLLISKKMIDTTLNTEFHAIRPDCYGRFCRYGFTGIMDYATLGADYVYTGFTVWDMKKGKLHKAVYYPKEEVGGAPIVIPKPGRNESNAVYVGTFTYNNINQESYFVLYDGENDNKLVVKLKVPHRVPFGFHGTWVTGEQLRAHIKYHNDEKQKSEKKK